MKADQLIFPVRQRNAWEAMDLGAPVLRASVRGLLAAWIVGVGPALLLTIVLFRDAPVWAPAWAPAYALLWFFKPWYDRCFLAVYSRGVFGQSTSVAQLVRMVPSLLKSGLLAGLTVYRLDPARSFNLPVWQLEGLRGGERWRRASVLHQGSHGKAMLLTLACVHFELLLVAGCYLLAWLMWPEHASVGWLAGGIESASWQWAELAFYAFAISIVEPLYCAAGFTLYLNRRSELEGWDLELRFRQIISRLGLTALVLVGLLVAMPALGQDATTNADTVDAQRARAAIEQVYSLPELGQPESQTRWRWRDDANASNPDERSGWPQWLDSLGETLALLFKVAVWAAVAFVVIWLLRNFQRLPVGQEKKAPREKAATHVGGLDIRRKSLPDQIPSAARAAWEAGDVRLAMSLLYRGALSELVERWQVKIRASDTEGDCLRRSQSRVSEPVQDYLDRLTRCWMQLAYGHRPPTAAMAITLIEQYSVLEHPSPEAGG